MWSIFSTRQVWRAEQSVLGSVLADNRAFADLDFLEPAAFADPAHGKLWTAIGRLIERGQPASPVTLRAYVESDADLSPLGLPYLGRLVTVSVPITDAAGGSDAFMLALFDGTTLVDCGVNYYTSAPGISQTFVLKTWYASPGVSARTFTVRLGANSGTSWALNNINTGAGFSPQSSIKSWLTIREIFP